MKKYFLLVLIFHFDTLSAQITTTPSKDLEYCPLTNTTFTVVVPGYDPSVFSSTNAPSVLGTTYPSVQVATSTTFSFVGKFQDVNRVCL